ncbi:tRNA (adenosine(37)-N6)-dimethylallyltransferase MiaA [Blattabacterium cuenoti]|uniref:tRNA (adenosine(37)-N6)-dimethylallyltransferase MiaA n=1 Tax=Blattabacterium cuenoti TaxID=1653831 RepID=UPI001CC23714|nr:tRNA (adenosine(37)-N6)-dimethylallyltransferase MiaA [Blattabacterium cuenoti]
MILGPTCVGKTYLSIFLAKRIKTEILSLDSRQFYRELKIGTSMPNEKDLISIPHHFIGHLGINQYYNAKCFERDFLKKSHELFMKYSILISVGGSSLYQKAISEGLSEIPEIDLKVRNNLNNQLKERGIEFLQKEFKKIKKKEDVLDIKNPRRIIRYLEIFQSTGYHPSFFFKKKNKKRPFSILKIGITLSKEEISDRIHKRVETMMEKGLLLEAKNYYPYRTLNSLKTIGYQELFSFLEKKGNNLKTSIENIKINTMKYAKKQMKWYKNEKDIIWFHPKEKDKILNFILENIKKMGNTGFEPVTSCV